MELLDLVHLDAITLAVTSAELGKTTIHPKSPSPRQVRIMMEQQGLTAPPPPGHPISNVIPVLRLYGKRLDKPSQSPYWDVSSLTLIAQLRPLLEQYRGSTLNLTITANGVKPTKRYSVEVNSYV